MGNNKELEYKNRLINMSKKADILLKNKRIIQDLEGLREVISFLSEVALQPNYAGIETKPTTRPMTAEDRKQWACDHRNEYWFTSIHGTLEPFSWNFWDLNEDDVLVIQKEKIDENGKPYPGKEWKEFPPMVQCGECGNTGFRINTVGDSFRCPTCSGSGWVVQE